MCLINTVAAGNIAHVISSFYTFFGNLSCSFGCRLKPIKLLATSRPSFKGVLLKNDLIRFTPDANSSAVTQEKEVVNTNHMCYE